MLRNVFLSLFALTLLASCSSTGVKVPNTEVCTVAGITAAGAICAMTLSPHTRNMTLDEFIEFLEPKEAQVDPTGKVTSPARGGALCQSAEDWNKQKTALEKACIKLGKKCTYEMRQTFDAVKRNILTLQRQASANLR